MYQIQKNKGQENTRLYDDYCKNMYGDRTCMLIKDPNIGLYEVRMLDKIENDTTTTSKKYLHVLIPNLLKYRYTVIIVEKICDAYEILAIHLPGQAFK